MTRHHMGRPLSRTLSSPLVALSPIGSPQECQVPTVHTFTTGLLKKNLLIQVLFIFNACILLNIYFFSMMYVCVCAFE